MAVQVYVDRVDMTPPQREPWMDDAACVNVENKDIFFPAKGENKRRDYQDPKEICAGCPVRIKCLMYALAHETNDTWSHGIFGGLSARERSALRRRLMSQAS